mmetsp:Transcript_42196/g.132144  ORF Transcript_42196/g.132144 Transcript_42196/m.132144 type:complete len:310 (+) Transcript_42196:211-1140(+)
MGYVLLALVLLNVIPEDLQNYLFTPAGVVVVGTIFPIIESIRAVCTFGTDDDTIWLTYWLAHGSFSYATEFVDSIAESNPLVKEHWYEFEFFFFLWLSLPVTDGATLLYDLVTRPYLVPVLQPIKKKLEGKLTALVLTAVNAGHIYMIWFAFMMMEEEAKRFIVIAAGTVYPLIASLVAVATPKGSDDTFWLTYWSCHGILFLAMDYAENYIGEVPGFYSLLLCATVYLMLPLFRGADAVFRTVIAPLAGLEENLLLRDAALLREELLEAVPESRRRDVCARAAAIFQEGQTRAIVQEEAGSNGKAKHQ